MIEIKPIEKFEIKGRGTCFTFEVKENNLPDTFEELKAAIMGKQVKINGIIYEAFGIDGASLGPLAHGTKAAILVR